MKRDMELIRDILLLLERHEGDPWELWDDYVPEGISEKEHERFSYHVMLLHDGGYIHAVDCSTMDSPDWKPVHLTWSGHEFLDTIRDPVIWSQTKEGAKNAGSFSIDILSALAKGLIKEKIKRHTGVDLEF